MVKILVGYAFFVCLVVGATALIVHTTTETPVRYRWDSGKKCIVYVSVGVWRSCESYTKEELNQFRLEWNEPLGYIE
jgi:hypothetical protein